MCTAVKLNKITDEVVGSVLKLMPGKVYIDFFVWFLRTWG